MTRLLSAPFPSDDRTAIEHALSLVRAGVLSIDDEGHVWRHAVVLRDKTQPVTPRRAENVSGKGYLRVSLHIPGSGLVQVMAHRLVWEAAHGPIPDDRQINHKDLNKQNNQLANLEVVTGAENIRHSYANGRPHPWSKGGSGTWRGKPLLTEETKTAMRAMRAGGAFLTAVAERFGVSVSHAHRVCGEKAVGR